MGTVAGLSRTHPCIGVCSTTTGDKVCRGCKRTVAEIRDWATLKPEHKREIMRRVEGRR